MTKEKNEQGFDVSTSSPHPIGEILTEHLLRSNAPLPVAYRKHRAEEASNKPWSPQTAQFSLYAPGINSPAGQHPYKQGTLMDVYRWMNSVNMMKLTNELRAIEDEKKQKLYKASHLPVATFSGTFAYRNQQGLLQHSGLLCFDFDHLGGKENLWRVRNLLEHDGYFDTMLLFTSPRGDGVKWVTHIDLERGSHEKWYRAIRNYLWRTYGLEADSAPANVASACFLCWDANMMVHPSLGLF